MSDYRDFKTVKDISPVAAEALAAAEQNWWQAESEMAATALTAEAQRLKSNNTRMYLNLRHARLYENMQLGGFDVVSWDQANNQLVQVGGISFNVIQSCIDTLESKLLKNRPRPSFQTSSTGGWAMRQKARKLDKFMQGLFYEVEMHLHAQRAGKDGLIFGTGAVKWLVDPNTGRLKCERAFVDEIYVDDADAKYGEPTSLYQRKLVSRSKLAAVYPEKAVEIAELKSEESNGRTTSSMVEVWEAWHLPSLKNANDGRHIIAIQNCVLVDEEWTLPCFPFAFFRYSEKTLGFWGRGVAERLTEIQKEMNRLTRSIRDQLHRKGKGRTYAAHGSINPAQFTNGTAELVLVKGPTFPQTVNQNAVSPEEFMQVDKLYQRAYQEVGVSELSAGAKKPAGLDAAVALREYNEIESDRFALPAQRLERFICFDNVRVALAMIRKFCKGKYVVKLPNKQNAIEVDWRDINLDESAYTIQIFPVSSLPQTPAARLQRIEELKAGGYITQAVASRLLEMPDIEDEMSLANAVLDDADFVVSAILDAAEPQLLPLEPYQNAQVILERALGAYLVAKRHDCPEERLQMMRDLIDAATAAVEASTQPEPVAAPAGPDMAAPVMPTATGIQNLDINMPQANGMQPAVPPLVG